MLEVGGKFDYIFKLRGATTGAVFSAFNFHSRLSGVRKMLF